MMNTATSLISDVIGSDAENSAFVYGCYSLADKFSNGALLYIMIAKFDKDEVALRWILVVTPIFCAINAFIMTYIGSKLYAGKMQKITGIKK